MTDTSNETTSRSKNSGVASNLGSLANAAKRTDLALALGIIAILAVLILPMPTWLLDLSLGISIAFSVLIMMTVLFINRPLEFNAFPMILLIATMLRLALNLASTRLILSDGHTGTDAAGQVIQAFGQFMMSGNPLIGVIVFAILVIVNFIVITKGSGRIAEVSARFSLDAMPGKQMAIDADLSSGLITEDEARSRREDLSSESSFFWRNGWGIKVCSWRCDSWPAYHNHKCSWWYYYRCSPARFNRQPSLSNLYPANRRRWVGQPNTRPYSVDRRWSSSN